MTNYNERLDEILQQLLIDYTAWTNGEPVPWNVKKAEAKQAITSLIKELVAEAKPDKQNGEMVYSTWGDGYDSGIDQFEQNLLKVLEEK